MFRDVAVTVAVVVYLSSSLLPKNLSLKVFIVLLNTANLEH